MQFTEAIKLALQSLWGNKMRSILTLLGMVISVASVIVVITMVNGANMYVATKLSDHGADVFTISRMANVILSGQDYFRFQKRKIIRIEDYEAVRDSCTECSEVGATLDRSVGVVFNGKSTTGTTMHGLTWTMLALNNTEIALGRGFTPADDDHGTHNVIVGYDIVDNLLGESDPIGKELRVDGISYTIVGVGARLGKVFGQTQDNWVAVPITTFQQTYGYNDSLDIYARAGGDAASMERAEDEVRVLMRARRHDAPGTPDDFELETNDTFMDIWKQFTAIFFSVVVGIASISLVVGGVVIMNIMLVSVTERTREIGVRKAIGARKSDIIVQFLTEAVVLTVMGGVLGLALGWTISRAAALVFPNLPTAVPLWAAASGVAVSVGVGLFFGIWPASRAARLDPVEALRHE
jgi:putative ABC transport system permease protein